MPFFTYTAKSPTGQNVKGKVEAKNAHGAAAELRDRKLFVIEVKALNEGSFGEIQKALFGVKFDDIVNFTRQLSTMISAGLPLANALNILSQQSRSEVGQLVTTILQDVEGGLTFADALVKHPKQFDKMYIQLVRAGELGGVLDNVLLRLADNMEKTKAFRGKTRGALIYPVIVIIAMVVVAFIMMIFVIPQMLTLYEDFDAELPWPTKLLMAVSGFMVNFWWAVILAVGGGIFAFNRWIQTDAGLHQWNKMQLRMPLFGPLIVKITLTEFTRTMSLLLQSGVSLLQSLEIVMDAVPNVIYRDALTESAKMVEKGVSLSQAIARFPDFPPILQQMTAVGEETGKLDSVLFKLSSYFEQESEQAVKNLTAAIEPMIMIVLGIGVGIMVIAVIMPIYNLTSQF